MKNQSEINYFLQKLTSEDSLSANTVNSYKNDLNLFANFLAQNNAEIKKATEDNIRAYLAFLHQENQPKAATLMRKISVLKSFFTFLEDENFIKTNPTLNISNPKKELVLPKTLSAEEILKLLKTAQTDNSEFGIRLYCMLEMLYSSGLRVTELVSLPFSAVQNVISSAFDKKNNYLIITGKGNKERLVPLSISAIKSPKNYLILRKESGCETSKWLFPSNFRSSKIDKIKLRENKLSFADEHLTRQRLHQMLKELAQNAGVDSKKVYPHAIRHSFATHLLNNGIDLRILQELLGHCDISTTQIYTHIVDAKLKEIILKHPLAKI